ncbi:MAG: SRPBCC domain-containing protein [Ornithinimicrobium sp.]
MLLASAATDVEADQATVFELFTSEAGLCRWMAKEATVDLRPGGSFRWVHDNGVAAAGEYLTVEPPGRVSFTYGWEDGPYAELGPGASTVDVRFEALGEVTRVTVEHSGVPGDFVQAHQEGWTHFLGLLTDVSRGVGAADTRAPSQAN